ncbi:carboxymuconolactone decarboxylase family protein [Streptomyces sp. RB6PN25]|uniref:Carboxymuconolactone decarboxylase family protein n=1 Tax=Streptomyces humicola TaxID=2953240 RepID=A0ABT1PT36_9ACTN|nr:carboxymuconolactone decarboxylase family protein [Streptomyces humicola]MCQ4080841.1 carboxymuconolactone decarboxylase family protein [Streptomyces humicola]
MSASRPCHLQEPGGARRAGRHRRAGGGARPAAGRAGENRVSQLNGCAFCLRMHTRDALAKH